MSLMMPRAEPSGSFLGEIPNWAWLPVPLHWGSHPPNRWGIEANQEDLPVRSNNPVLSRPDAFRPAPAGAPSGFQPDAYYNPQQGQGYAPGAPQDSYYQGHPQASQPVPQTGRMTIEDVITKTAILMLVVVGVAGVTLMLLPLQLLMPVVIVSSLAAFVTVLIVSRRRQVSVPGVFAYAVIEGILIGAFSKLFEFLYPGIVLQAVMGTIVAAFTVLAAYKFLNVRVSGRLAKIVVASTIGLAIAMLLNLVLFFFNINLGFATIGPQAGPLAWLAAGLGVVLACASLLMDFEAIEQGVRMGAPDTESWRGAFGLIVTLVWLYTNLLRILSFFRN